MCLLLHKTPEELAEVDAGQLNEILALHVADMKAMYGGGEDEAGEDAEFKAWKKANGLV